MLMYFLNVFAPLDWNEMKQDTSKLLWSYGIFRQIQYLNENLNPCRDEFILGKIRNMSAYIIFHR